MSKDNGNVAESLGPDGLSALLEKYGLKIIKTKNTAHNVGKSPELVMCQQFSIRERTSR